MKRIVLIFKYLKNITIDENQNFFRYIIGQIILNILKIWISIAMIAILIESLQYGKETRAIFVTTIALVLILIIDITYCKLNMKFKISANSINTWLNLKIYKAMMKSEYEKWEKEREKYEFAKIAVNEVGVLKVAESFQKIIESLINIIIAIATLSFVNIYILIIVAFVAGLNIISETYKIRCQYSVNKEMSSAELNLYYARDYLTSPKFAKEIRTNNMSNYVLLKLRKSIDYFTKLKIDVELKYLKKFWVVFILDGVLFIVVYLFGISEYTQGNMEIGYFSIYIASMTTFIFSILEITRTGVDISGYSMYIEALQDYIKPKCNQDTSIDQISNNDKVMKDNMYDGSKEFSVEFVKVGFKYPESEEFTLRNISFKVNSGEKVAIVGKNGAGKTTLIKILLRLYTPTEGKILINDRDYCSYSESEIIRLFSVILQDFGIYSFPINNNISMDSEYNETKIAKTLKEVGLIDKIHSLHNGGKTYITQRLDKNGVELSGGESQKLAMARAIYKDAPIYIFDEPTSALSPESEYEIYSKFENITQDKTTFFISHKLASCKLCDKIIVLEDGEVENIGNHKTLIKTENLYSRMYNIQAESFNV